LKYDIRALTTDELEAELEARLAKRNLVLMKDCPSIEEEETPVLDSLWDNEWIAHLHCLPIIVSMS
jgi:hypothetical protein